MKRLSWYGVIFLIYVHTITLSVHTTAYSFYCKTVASSNALWHFSQSSCFHEMRPLNRMHECIRVFWESFTEPCEEIWKSVVFSGLVKLNAVSSIRQSKTVGTRMRLFCITLRLIIHCCLLENVIAILDYRRHAWGLGTNLYLSSLFMISIHRCISWLFIYGMSCERIMYMT